MLFSEKSYTMASSKVLDTVSSSEETDMMISSKLFSEKYCTLSASNC